MHDRGGRARPGGTARPPRGEPAIWIGHDWGSAVAGALAAHEPRRSRGVVLTSLAHFPQAFTSATLVPLVDRSIYPVEQYPDGQWNYYHYCTTRFEAAVADLDADPAASLASIFRAGDPVGVDKVSPSATVTRRGGRFGDTHRAPATPPDPTLWPPDDVDQLVEEFRTNGFRASCAWYVNDDTNLEYARRAPAGGRLTLPVLFVNGEWDVICSTNGNRQGDPMRAACSDLTVTQVPGGHRLPVEREGELVAAIRNRLRAKDL